MNDKRSIFIYSGSLLSYIMPDYEFRPQKKKGRERLSSVQETGQAAERDPGVSSFFSQAIPAQCKLLGLPMYLCPTLVPYTVHYNPYPSTCPYNAIGLYPRVQIHCPKLSFFGVT